MVAARSTAPGGLSQFLRRCRLLRLGSMHIQASSDVSHIWRCAARDLPDLDGSLLDLTPGIGCDLRLPIILPHSPYWPPSSWHGSCASVASDSFPSIALADRDGGFIIVRAHRSRRAEPHAFFAFLAMEINKSCVPRIQIALYGIFVSLPASLSIHTGRVAL